MLNSNTNSQQPWHKPWITRFLLPLGSVLIAVLAFLTQNVQVPKWAIALAGFYLITVAAVALYDPVVRLFSFLSRKKRERQLARTPFPRLAENVRQLAALIAQGNANTLLYVLQEAAGWVEVRGQQPLVDMEHVETMRTW